MPPFFTLGKIVTASSQQDAIDLFHHRKQSGIGGVIFTPEIVFPVWTPEEKQILSSETYHSGDTNASNKHHRFRPSTEWEKVAGKFPNIISALVKSFNTSTHSPVIQFWDDEDISEGYHRDKSAKKGWVHFHFAGAGMKCLYPAGENSIQLKVDGHILDLISQDVIEDLISQGKIKALNLQEKQAIVFDETMVHTSAKGSRFRALGYA